MPIDRDATVRAYLAGPRSPVRPRDAATVAVVRDGPDGVETFLLHRRRSMSFAAGMHVFPGGSVDATDGGPAGRDDPQLGRCAAAAVRETFEECGVRLDPQLLVPWSRWVTPEFSPRRFDTRFFVAVLPSGERPHADRAESDDGRWFGVRTALAAYHADTLPMMTVTASTLRDLAAFDSVADVGRPERDLAPRMLRAVESGDDLRYVIDVGGVAVDEHEFLAGPIGPIDERSTA